MENRHWTKPDVERFLRNEVLPDQRISLPFGLATPGEDRSHTRDLIFREGIRGKTVLDVGSALGYFCIEALARGATRAVGWDVDPESIRQARLIADMLHVPAEYQERDIEEEATLEGFDVVLCLNVLHHLRDPIAAIRKLIRMTRETLILEIATLGSHDRRRLGLSSRITRSLAKFPIIVTGRDGRRGGFYFTPSAVENLLRFQWSLFGRVKVIPSRFKDRFIVVAHRRRIQHLLVVAGPTSSGKTTLIDQMLAGRSPSIASMLEVEDLRHWPVAAANSVGRMQETVRGGLIFHYDFLRPYRRGARVYDRDEALDVLGCADQISFLTLWTPPDRLSEQYVRSEIYGAATPDGSSPATVAQWLGSMAVRLFSLTLRVPLVRVIIGAIRVRRSRRYGEMLTIYRDPARVVDLYRRWFEFCDRSARTRSHLIVELNGDLRVLSRTEWEALVQSYQQDTRANSLSTFA